MTSETQDGQQQPVEVNESTTLLDPPSSQATNNSAAAADNEVPAAQEAAITSTSGNNGVSEEESVVPTQHHNSDDEGEHPTVSVVIDEDEDGEDAAAVPTPQLGQSSGAPPETEEHMVSLPYQDHNYDMGRSAVRTNSSRDNNESFPIIEGLASYIGDEPEHYNNVERSGRMAPIEYRRVRGRDSVSSSSVEQMRMQHGFHPTVISTNHHHPGVVTSSRQFGGQNVVRTIRGSDGYSPSVTNLHPGTRQVSIVGGQLPAVFNPRRVVRPSTASDYGQGPPTLRASRPAADGAGYATASTTRYTTLTPQGHRGIGPSPITNLNPSTTAAVMNDPSRAANDNAPAPFFIPSKGFKPISRNRISTPGRVQPLTGAAGTPATPSASTTTLQQPIQGSPRKVYQQLGRGGRGGDNAANDMHTYVKRDLRQETPPDTSAIDVVEEEEAQNAKFFQRQSQSLGATIRNKQVSQYPAGQEPAKQHESPRSGEHLGTPVHLQQRSSTNQQHNNNMQSAGFRNTQQSAVPSILQRGTRQVGTTPQKPTANVFLVLKIQLVF
uniref:Uncharacterized protein n=1 Tax=Ditylenchus dipsaci TaxID=166011 RepID=A0A915E3W7_9BILA